MLDPTGKSLGIVVHGQTATTNLCFGGDDWQTVFFTSRTTVGRFQGEGAWSPRSHRSIAAGGSNSHLYPQPSPSTGEGGIVSLFSSEQS